MTNQYRAIVVGVAFVVFGAAAHAQSDVEDDLTRVIHDQGAEVTQRVVALDQLRRADHDLYLGTLSGLVSGDEQRFAVYAAEELVNLIAMIGSHSASMMSADAESLRHDMTFVMDVNKILHMHAASPYREVREVVVPYLVSQGDEVVLKSIREATGEGIISDEEALGYYIAALPEIGTSDLRRYAEMADNELAKRAIDVLASDTSQQAYLRDMILTNADVPEAQRAAALVGLAKYDDSFLSYATKPAVVDLALRVERVPGAEELTGADLIARRVQQDIRRDPSMRTVYTTSLQETSDVLDQEATRLQSPTVQEAIIRKIRNYEF